MKTFKNIIVLVLTLSMLCVSVSATLMGDPVTTDSTKGNFTDLSITTVANKLTVSGALATASETNVTVYVTDGTTNIASYQMLSNASGAFEVELLLNPERYNAENTASVTVGATEYNSRKVVGIPLYSQAELDACVAAFKAITNGTQMGEFFANYSTMLGISGSYEQDDYDFMYTKYAETSYADVADCGAVAAAVNALVTYNAETVRVNALNTAFTWTNTDGIVYKNVVNSTVRFGIPAGKTINKYGFKFYSDENPTGFELAETATIIGEGEVICNAVIFAVPVEKQATVKVAPICE